MLFFAVYPKIRFSHFGCSGRNTLYYTYFGYTRVKTQYANNEKKRENEKLNLQSCFKHIVNEHNRKHTDTQHVNCILARYTAIPTCQKCGYASFNMTKRRCQSKTPVIVEPSDIKGDRGLNPPYNGFISIKCLR